MESLIMTWDVLEINFSFAYIVVTYCLMEIHSYVNYSLSNLNLNFNFINDYELKFTVFHTFKRVFFKIWINVNKLLFKTHMNLPFAKNH